MPQFEIDFILGIDKFAHMILFGIQAWLLVLAYRYQNKYPMLRFAFQAAIFSTIYGAVIEVLQATIFINRSFDYADMLANASGAFLCIPLSIIFFKRNKKLSKN